MEWLGNEIPYAGTVAGEEVKGDTFPMTWAADGEIYASAGDPAWGPSRWGLDVEKLSGVPPGYTISQVNPMVDYIGWGGAGPKPSGMISVKGVLYLAYQNLCHVKPPVYGTASQHGSDSVVAASKDSGLTWTPEIQSLGLGNPTFAGARFGGPSFVNFGRDNEGARDEYVYAVSADQWDNGGHLLLGRVPQDRICDAAAWEWVRGVDGSNVPHWTPQLALAQAVLSDDRWISLPEMVYLAAVERYLLLTWHLKADFSNEHGSSLVVYDAPEPWGPFTLVHYEEDWESREMNPYCPRVPLKWMESDGRTGWLQFSGSWSGKTPHYRSHVRPFRLRVR
jgi:hypothetical protein